MKKFFMMFLIVFCSAFLINAIAVSEPTMEIPLTTSSLSLQEKESSALKKYNHIMREWAYDPDHISDTDANFPEFFGGAYINNEKLFVIQVTNTFEEARKYFSTIIDLTDVAFERVEYSFDELKNAQCEIENKLNSVKNISNDELIGVGISVKNNKVTVFFQSSESAQKAAQVSGFEKNDIVEFVDIKDFVNESSQGKDYSKIPDSRNEMGVTSSVSSSISVAPGDKIYHLTSTNLVPGAPRSVGYWAYDASGNLGIVTAPHGAIKRNDIVFDDDSDVIIGVAGTPYYTGTTVDAVFVPCPKTNASGTDTRIYPSRAVIGWEFLLSSNTNLLSTGATVYALGADTGCMMGSVIAFNITTSSGVRDCVLTNCIGDEGDSGGIIAGEGTSSERDIAGIMIAAREVDDFVVYAKAENINEMLGVDPY